MAIRLIRIWQPVTTMWVRLIGPSETLNRGVEYSKKGLEMRKTLYGDTPHPSLATSYNNVGVAYFELKDYAAAYEHSSIAINLSLKHGTNWPKSNVKVVATWYNKITETYSSAVSKSNPTDPILEPIYTKWMVNMNRICELFPFENHFHVGSDQAKLGMLDMLVHQNEWQKLETLSKLYENQLQLMDSKNKVRSYQIKALLSQGKTKEAKQLLKQKKRDLGIDNLGCLNC